jgi:hypothetical protein
MRSARRERHYVIYAQSTPDKSCDIWSGAWLRGRSWKKYTLSKVYDRSFLISLVMEADPARPPQNISLCSRGSLDVDRAFGGMSVHNSAGLDRQIGGCQGGESDPDCEGVRDNDLQVRGDCLSTRKSYKTSHLWVGLWIKNSPNSAQVLCSVLSNNPMSSA